MKPDEDVIQLVIMAGQSNMVGHKTKVSDLASRWHKPLDRCFVWKGQEWNRLQAGALDQKSAFGPELSFAHRLAQTTNAPIGIVKVAKNGAFLSTHWSPKVRGGLFDELVSQVQDAMMNRPAHLLGLIWMQGEADSINLEDAMSYKGRFTTFVTKLRIAIGAPNLPVVSGVVNPPLDLCPHAKLVRAALANNSIGNHESISIDDLALKRDNLHLTAVGLSKLGKRFANKLAQVQPLETSTRIQKWIWKTEQYQCWYVGDSVKPDSALISFPFAVTESGFNEHAFGQVYFEKQGKSAVYIRSNESLWFQSQEVFEIADKIRLEFGKKTKFVHYGASMGAYAALLLSKKIKPEMVIAIAPQYSIDRDIVPWESRWRKSANRIGTFIHRLEDHIDERAKKIVIYDGNSEDKKQIALLPCDKSWCYVNLPFSSHQSLRFLTETGTLTHLLERVPESHPDMKFIKMHSHANRHKSVIYWMSLAHASRARRPSIARFAFRQAIKNGGPTRRIEDILSAIDEEINLKNGGESFSSTNL